jgi:hypothetical protein
MDSEAIVSEILKKHGETLASASSIVKVDGLAVLTAYLKAVLPGFQKVAVVQQHSDDDFANIAITFCPCPKFYAPKTHYLKFIYNGAPVQCSSNPDELLEAVELAAKYSNLGIGINDNSTVFFKDNANYHGGNGFFLFKQGMTINDILETAAHPPAPGTFVI